jgi:1,2-diacylglycerol 3-alpha-glucosyltransferase
VKSNPRRRIVWLTPGKIGPHHLARLETAAGFYHELWVINVLEDDPREWQTQTEALAGRLVVVGQKPGEQNEVGKIRGVLRALENRQPEVVVVAGYRNCNQIGAAIWARLRGAISIMQSDTWVGDRPRYRLKEFIKSRLFVRPYADAAFVPGLRADQYVQSLGISSTAIWRGSYVVDNDYFFRKSQEVRDQASSWQYSLDLPQDYFLTAARLSPEKNLLRLLEAFGRYRAMGGHWSLVIVGSGPQERQLRRVSRHAGWGSKVYFAGWRQCEQLAAYYALARCFILPSLSEPWGLVVNEAMACGAPVLVSRNCGCLPELCQREINGYDFDPLDVEELANLLLKVSEGGLDLSAMGQASRRIIAGFTLDSWGQAFRDCVEVTSARLGK